MNCCFCCESVDNGDLTVTLKEKGCRNINSISQTLDQCTIQVKTGQCVHKKCRLDFIRSKKTGSRNIDQNERTTIARRFTTSRFVFKEHCFFCGQPAKYEGRKRGYEVIPVRTKDFQDKIQEACKVRNDEWAETVQGRLEFAQDLHAADAVYTKRAVSDGKTDSEEPWE